MSGIGGPGLGIGGKIRIAALRRLQLHPLAGLVPEMSPPQWASFMADVAERGILTPLELAADGRTVLDGRHRLKAALELGQLEVPTTRANLGGSSEFEYMLKAALHRRHLSDDQRAILASRLAEEMGDDRRHTAAQTAADARWHPDASGSPATTTHERPRSREEVSRSFGVQPSKVRQAHGLRTVAPELAEKVLAGKLRLKEAESQWRRRQELAAIEDAPSLPASERCRIWCGDAPELAAQIEDESVDLVFTDPPYMESALPLWAQLGELAARVLKPGAFLVCYSGHLCLDRVMAALSAHLTYYWTAAIRFQGPKPAVYDRQVRSGFRVVVIYVKPPITYRPFFHDLIEADKAPDKRFHDWGQSVKPARYLVERFSRPDQTVLDPFCGAGAFPAAALLEGRRAIGIELDPEHAEVARKRAARVIATGLDGAPIQKPSGTVGGGVEGPNEG